jgi:SepF-like predicted cell division protein (DUF552 family)
MQHEVKLMAFKMFRKDEPENEEEFIEIESETEGERRRVNIKIENLNDYRDIDNIQRLVREGNIVFLRIKRMKERDLGELKRSIERLRRATTSMNGDIVGVDEEFLILTPSFAKVYRGEPEITSDITK